MSDQPLPAGAGDGKRRPWWPAALAGGLVVASIVGVIVFAVRNAGGDSISSPPPTSEDPQSSVAATTVPPTPTTVLASLPTAEASVARFDDCVEVQVGANVATGCFDESESLGDLNGRTLIAQLDAPYVVTFSDAGMPRVSGMEPGELCRWDEISQFLEGFAIVEPVVCSDDAGLIARLGAHFPAVAPERVTTWFTLPSDMNPSGTELGAGTAVDGLPGALSFASPGPAWTCTMLLPSERSGWKETCGDLETMASSEALVGIGDEIYEVTIGANGTVDSAVALDRMPPPNGCTLDSARELVVLLPTSSIVGGIGCLDDSASLTSGSVLLQNGPPDGSIWMASREGDVWKIVESGTGIDEDFSFPLAAVDIWTAWPGDTSARPNGCCWTDVAVHPDVNVLAGEIILRLGTLGPDPEFPTNPRVVEVEPDGLPLLVFQIDVGDDDSVGGQVVHVWIEEVLDADGPVGWQVDEVLVSDICLRGTGGELCV